MLILGILPMPDGYLNDAYDAAQVHALLPAMMCLSTAEGEKPRRGG